jgi:hypothetical protein
LLTLLCDLSVHQQVGFKAMVIGRGKDTGETVKRLWGCVTLTATCRTQLKNLSCIEEKENEGRVHGWAQR